MVHPVPEKAQHAAAASAAGPSILLRIQDLLTRRNVPFDLTHHRPVYTSAEAAGVLGESLHSGAKALVVKADDRFVRINFNAGSHTGSVRMLYVDYEAVEESVSEVFSRPAESGF
jgi:hypothetical protein